MQEIKKRRIVLASVLKPVDDTRMYEKLAVTLASSFDVHIIGYPSRASRAGGDIFFHPLRAFQRVSPWRMLAPLAVLRQVIRLRPALLIVCTAELLTIGVMARLLCGCRVMYDIQENYAQNIRYGSAWPAPLRPLLAIIARAVEYSCAPMICHFLLAERSYQGELGFIGERFTIVENKFVTPSHVPAPRQHVPSVTRLLFSGTLAETTGVFEAIALTRKLHAADNGITLCVAGYAAQTSVRRRLKDEARASGFITLLGVDRLLPHAEIAGLIAAADFGIIAYPENRSTWHAMPTKLFEYLGCRLPVLLVDNPLWVEYCAPYSAAVPFTLGKVDAAMMLERMRNGPFYTTVPADVFWEIEAPKVIGAVRKVLKG